MLRAVNGTGAFSEETLLRYTPPGGMENSWPFSSVGFTISSEFVMARKPAAIGHRRATITEGR